MKRPDLFQQWLAAEAAETPSRAVHQPADVLPWVKRLLRRRQECFVVVTLDGDHEVIRVREVTRGIVNRTLIHPREVFWGAVRDRATAVVIAHNHPSGNVDPSAEDVDVTNRLAEAGRVMGILVLDHVIVSRSGYYSFLEEGRIDG